MGYPSRWWRWRLNLLHYILSESIFFVLMIDYDYITHWVTIWSVQMLYWPQPVCASPASSWSQCPKKCQNITITRKKHNVVNVWWVRAAHSCCMHVCPCNCIPDYYRHPIALLPGCCACHVLFSPSLHELATLLPRIAASWLEVGMEPKRNRHHVTEVPGCRRLQLVV